MTTTNRIGRGARLHRHCLLLPLFLCATVLALTLPALSAEEEMTKNRREMVNEVMARSREFAVGGKMRELSPRVLETMTRVPRHEFVPRSLAAQAYDNRPLPIGHGQTISQPTIVALMTDLLELTPGQSVLEIGTGSGYQAAVLAEMGAQVATIEIIEPLATAAAARLKRLGYQQVAAKVGDGYHGWPEQAPFDAIIVTAAASHVPPPLISQLKPGGRMVIPVGAPFLSQHLMLVEKRADGSVVSRQLLPVAFVPLTGDHE